MDRLVDFLLMLVVLLGLGALGSTRVADRIRMAAAQGAVLGVLLLLVHRDDISVHLVVLAALSIGIKGLGIPWLLFRGREAIKGGGTVKPYMGSTLALVLGAVALGVAFALASLLPLPIPSLSRLIVPVSLSTVFSGMLLLVIRRTAISQVLGYVLLENGIFTFSLALAGAVPTLVEMGILLDLFAAVFVMGITIYQIDREFDHIDASRLRELHDINGHTPWPLGSRERHAAPGRRPG